MLELVVLFFVVVGGCTWIFRLVGNIIFRNRASSGYVDRSVHHHYYDNRKVYFDGKEYKNLK